MIHKLLEVFLWILVLVVFPVAIPAQTFVNFETAPVHPIALGPDGKTLAVCNLPDGRLELFDVSTGSPVPTATIAVGIDPVTVRFRTTNEAWVVNLISSSISVVDLTRRLVVDSIKTRSGPADVVFAGSPLRAYVSCADENVVQVFDPTNRLLEAELPIDGDRPKAMAVSPDATKVYVAIFESGNASTILAGAALSHPAGPYGGKMPVPNNGMSLKPPLFINPAVPASVYTEIPDSLIVRKNAGGRWMDDNQGDWTQFISGTNSTLPDRDGLLGRPAGWDIPDRDLAMIDTATHAITYASGLMNLCMAAGVNPVSGTIAVVGTDATNERRFEPNLRGTFIRVEVALVDPAGGPKVIRDLNPHLNYAQPSVSLALRNRSIGDPRGIVWNAAGNRAYIAGMGSRNLVMIDGAGNRVDTQALEVGEGPVGLALDEGRGRLYVLNRFSSEVVVVNLATFTVTNRVSLFDPTPSSIKLGRKHLYDTRGTSGLGQLSCASCHVDGRTDRLAWDLGNPAANGLSPSGEYFHPMKGPLMTQTLQDIIGHEPLHWRGDRAGIEEFNGTFTNLMAMDQLLTTNEMQQFKAFLATIYFPPNRFRNFDNSLRTNLPLPGVFGVDPVSGRPNHIPLESGNALRGRDVFTIVCVVCHREESGRGVGMDDLLVRRENNRPFKVAQLRNIADRLGMDTLNNTSRSGFGLRFDGRDDSVTRFLVDVFGMKTRNEIADLNAFLLSFTGSDILHVPTPGTFSRDTAAAVGWQITLTNSVNNAVVEAMLALARSPTGRVELIARGPRPGTNRGWLFNRATGYFQSDRNNEDLVVNELLALAGSGREFTFTMVPAGTGTRLGLDRDLDGYYDRTELELGFDPMNAASHGTNHTPQITSIPFIVAHPGDLVTNIVHVTDPDPGQTVTLSNDPGGPAGATFNASTGEFRWRIPVDHTPAMNQMVVRAIDNGNPPLSHALSVSVLLNPMRMTHRITFSRLVLTWESIPQRVYHLQSTARLGDPWVDLPGGDLTATTATTSFTIPSSIRTGQQFYRVRVD